MRPADNIDKLIKNLHLKASRELDKRVHDDITKALAETQKAKSAQPAPNIWRIIMKSPITKLAAAAVIIIAAVLTINTFYKPVPVISTASAAQVLTEAAKAVEDVQSIHIKAKMRTLPGDNFSLIGLDFDFVPIEMWKKVDDEGIARWRIEKPERVVVTDGNSTTMLIRPNSAVKGGPYPIGCFDTWCGHLMNVNGLLDSALQEARNRSNAELCLQHIESNGVPEIVLEIESRAIGDYTNDYLKNSFISDSDHKKVYYFDAETKLLTGFEVYVHTDEEDVLVFEVTDIEYNPQIDDELFTLELPQNVIWYEKPKPLPANENEKYKKMTPKQVAEAFFQACAEENWDEFLKFWSASRVDERLKEYLGGLEIISVGEPFKSGLYPGWFVPYEIKLLSTAPEFYMRLSNANSAKRFVITGMCDSKLYPVREMKWSNEPDVLQDNDAYAKMSPEDIVRAFNTAFSKGDWDEIRKFMPDFEADGLKHDIEIWKKQNEFKEGQPFCEIAGESFWSAEHSAYFVKCRQYVEGGQTKKHNLAVRNDNPAKRWVVDGGI